MPYNRLFGELLKSMHGTEFYRPPLYYFDTFSRKCGLLVQKPLDFFLKLDGYVNDVTAEGTPVFSGC